MPVSTLPSAEEFEEKGHADIELVGFRYTGDRSTKTDHDIRRRVGYAGPPKFQRGRVYLALLPTWLDEDHVANANIGVHALEARNDFEVIYDAPRLAEALLERNYLPPEIFYEGFDQWKRRKVFDKIDLEDVGRIHKKDDEEPFRDQLREIAGIERDDGESVSQQRADEYTGRFSRSDASEVVKILRQDADEIDLRTAGLTDMAEYLTRLEPDVVEQAVDVALGDAELEDVDLDPEAVTGSGGDVDESEDGDGDGE